MPAEKALMVTPLAAVKRDLPRRVWRPPFRQDGQFENTEACGLRLRPSLPALRGGGEGKRLQASRLGSRGFDQAVINAKRNHHGPTGTAPGASYSALPAQSPRGAIRMRGESGIRLLNRSNPKLGEPECEAVLYGVL